MGGDLSSANKVGLSGMKMGAFIGAGIGAFGGYRYAKKMESILGLEKR